MFEADRPIAIVTGGAKRVGRAISEMLARQGFVVAFTYLSSADDAAALASSIGGIAIRADLTDPASAIASIERSIGPNLCRVKILIHNASIYEPDAVATAHLHQIRKLMAIHYESPLLITKLVSEHLRSNAGSIVTMLDIQASRPWPVYTSYCASKAALWNLTLSLAKDLAPQVRVNGIAPGVVEWPEGYPEAEKQKYLARVPLMRPGTPQEVAQLVKFLAVDSTYVTGQVVPLDGGRSIA